MNLRVEVRRGGQIESVHDVSVVVVDEADRILGGAGDPEVFWRSAAKPFQALPIVESGAADRFGLTEAELSLACGSHNGTPVHTAAAAALLAKIGATEDDLHCGPHPPFDEDEARALRARGERPGRLHNNCSGKHAGMLAVCRARGWPIADYNRIAHPLQQEILATLGRVVDLSPTAIGTAVDGCGAVVFRTPLSALARAFRRFAAADFPPPHGPAGARLLAALRREPVMMAGRGRLCTALLEATGGRLIGKVGAEGIYGLGLGWARGGEWGRGVAIKVRDGAGRAAAPALIALSRHLGWLDDEEHERLRPFWDLPLSNHQGERVGEIVVPTDAMEERPTIGHNHRP